MFTAKAAFVVEIYGAGKMTAARLSGRVEHVLSGANEEFSSGAELLQFIEEVLPPAVRSERK